MRVLSSQAGGEGHSHSHTHSHSHSPVIVAKSTSIETTDTSALKSRKVKEEIVTPVIVEKQEINPSLKLSAYLNLFGDFTHNITDGLAMAASFYSSPALGAVTTIATFCHEIPHEVGPSFGLQR